MTERQRTCAAAITRWLTTSTRYGLKASGRTAVALPQGFVAHKGFLATRLRATPVVLYKDIGLDDPPLRLTQDRADQPTTQVPSRIVGERFLNGLPDARTRQNRNSNRQPPPYLRVRRGVDKEDFTLNSVPLHARGRGAGRFCR